MRQDQEYLWGVRRHDLPDGPVVMRMNTEDEAKAWYRGMKQAYDLWALDHPRLAVEVGPPEILRTKLAWEVVPERHAAVVRIPRHEPTDTNCVRFDGDPKVCWYCAKLDSAVWLTQREMFEEGRS